MIQCGGIWFANGKFGVTWKLVQAVVKPKETLKGKCHIVLSAEDKKILEDDNGTSDNNEVVDDSDGEDVAGEVAAEIEAAASTEDEEVEAEPEPVKPPPKKKRAVKKAT